MARKRLPRLVGMGVGQIDAKRAYEIGLVNKVVPAAQLMDDTKKFAKKLAGLPGFVLKMAKYSINYGYDLTLDNANRLEMECCAQ